MAFPKYSANCKQQMYFWIYTYVNWHSIIPVISHFQAKRLMYLFETFARLLHFFVSWVKKYFSYRRWFSWKTCCTLEHTAKRAWTMLSTVQSSSRDSTRHKHKNIVFCWIACFCPVIARNSKSNDVWKPINKVYLTNSSN